MKEESMASSESLIDQRDSYSKKRLEGLRSRLKELPETAAFPGLTIIGAGSFARLEGSAHSDIDLFFFCDKPKSEISDPRTKELSLFGKLIGLNEELGFPPFSADSKFLEVMYIEDIAVSLGSPLDDHHNFFTARMLLLLESKCLYNNDGYVTVVEKIISYYYRDYPKHPVEFFPTFLLNDITRYWKTILLNYENKRSLSQGEHSVDRKIKHKIKNFKLKFSRMTTCFASIAAIGSFQDIITEEKIKELVFVTPRGRLNIVCQNIPNLKSKVEEILKAYEWFIEKTGLSSEELEKAFHDKQNRDAYFEKADNYGLLMYEFLDSIDHELNRKQKLIRRLVI
jgi:hypothetical protein